ncbi:hypothetical protein ANOM_010531 [Aspergillus nomiae NRRL 13137]|uniref:MARVEL domain-containing protein n=1 Tax=Aspergillus nomiae NRRL (strain ATCC 15546 / NRRL 13137 / CBS 260.88 / M93) TaxID=1509407 RepID=A0A0L1IQ98_ASPN3|nr:uncharacterized protein ANOM_010531 [Aspergillus nomiae NRRL 13137]KNG81525.1 hypothetical protein ANOM_010531 [Aspergillus nomiae NRRL 13137]
MNLLDTRWKLPLHCFQIFLIVMVIGLSIPRLFMKNQPRTRASTIGLGMSAKSLVIILYQLLTEHVAALRKWGSLKAYTMLNALEVVFWAAVTVLTIQANVQMCVAPGCILGWGVAITSINLSVLAIYATVLTYRDWKQCKGGARSDGYKRAHELRCSSPVPSA